MPISEAKAPPPKRQSSQPRAQSSGASNFSKAAGYEQSLKALAGTGVMLTSLVRQPADSMALANYFGDDATVRKLAENATRNPYFGKLLDALEGSGGPLLETFVLLLPLIMQVLCNHGIIGANPAMGVLPKEVLQMQAAMAAQAAQDEAEKLAREAMEMVSNGAKVA